MSKSHANPVTAVQKGATQDLSPMREKGASSAEHGLEAVPGKPQAPSEAGVEPPPGRLSRERLVEKLNEDLSREYQAIIAYVVYSQVLKGAAYMNIAAELEKHAAEELSHALTISEQIDYLGGMPTVQPKPVKTSEKATEMLRFDLENEKVTIRNYRERIRECEELREYAMAEHIRDILLDEQDHLISLATALGEEVPKV